MVSGQCCLIKWVWEYSCLFQFFEQFEKHWRLLFVLGAIHQWNHLLLGFSGLGQGLTGLLLELPGEWGSQEWQCPWQWGVRARSWGPGAGLGAARVISAKTVHSVSQGTGEGRARQQQHGPVVAAKVWLWTLGAGPPSRGGCPRRGGKKPVLGLSWAKSSGVSDLLRGKVLWHQISEWDIVSARGPRATLPSAIAQAFGKRFRGGGPPGYSVQGIRLLQSVGVLPSKSCEGPQWWGSLLGNFRRSPAGVQGDVGKMLSYLCGHPRVLSSARVWLLFCFLELFLSYFLQFVAFHSFCFLRGWWVLGPPSPWPCWGQLLRRMGDEWFCSVIDCKFETGNFILIFLLILLRNWL